MQQPGIKLLKGTGLCAAPQQTDESRQADGSKRVWMLQSDLELLEVGCPRHSVQEADETRQARHDRGVLVSAALGNTRIEREVGKLCHIAHDESRQARWDRG
jgi:hypothetical protein